MNFSDDVLKLNPELARSARTSLPKRVRLLPADGFDSQLERNFNEELIAQGLEVMPHGFTFHLPGGVDYTPDFVAWDARGASVWGKGIGIYEVKGNLRQKNARDSRTRFKIAAGLYPCFSWIWVTRFPSGQWVETVLR